MDAERETQANDNNAHGTTTAEQGKFRQSLLTLTKTRHNGGADTEMSS